MYSDTQEVVNSSVKLEYSESSDSSSDSSPEVDPTIDIQYVMCIYVCMYVHDCMRCTLHYRSHPYSLC